MASPERFQRLASKLINKTFVKFRGDIIFTELGEWDFQSQTNIEVNTNAKGIRVDFKKSEFDGQSIQQGDFKLIIEQQSISVNVRSDDIAIQFKQYPTKAIPNPVFKSLSIESVDEDAAQAVYTLQVRVL